MSNKFVIGGGWSVSRYAEHLDDLTSFGHVIGVNDAAIHTNVHEAITMDRLWFEHRWPLLRDLRVQKVWVREKCDCNVPRKTEHDNWLTFRHFNKIDPSVTPGELHGGNSGTCAINLAFQQMMSGDNLFLLGFDMQKGPEGQPYWYPPYPWTHPEGATKPGHFKTWVHDMHGFARYAKVKQLNVYNVTTRSQIPHFPKMTFEQMTEMLNGL
jgi:hypothetical protein